MARKTAATTTRADVPTPPVAAIAGATGKRATVVAHLVTGEDIKSALMSSDDELDVEFEGDDPRDQHAKVDTDDAGVLTWGLVLETAFANAAWRLTLTKLGDPEGPAVAAGTTSPQGRVVRSGIMTV